MGTWNTKINGNDTFQDIYQNFFDAYNQGKEPADISKQIQDDYAEMFEDSDDRNNSLFGLALAQWETKSLDQTIYKQVKEIIESGNDLEVWKGLGADSKTLEKRKKELDKFLIQISTVREKPKRRVRPKFEYAANHLLTLPAPDGQKTFEILESYVNGEYKDTSSGITWAGGGGSVFYFYTKGKFVTARWVDSQTLEIRHDKTIEFAKKDETFYFCGDQGVIKYIAE
ncbi:hypothetical protein [Haliscomenobacter hydrossis]|uniref:Uncharacterized protein n=1 Tax=Haliscomenobacter hydrossis (strain ATCC 27775 / DSM 1100 / LMG 10767 / O) TaxID=760192 RepID=F4KZC3_HALH1|nr:hypothetical protein [Haliscomenobacter hydrossis]AEE48418.1 hypothetical protein Halhy_0508 [Haliscomenobacter hydrossis DSM 1100]